MKNRNILIMALLGFINFKFLIATCRSEASSNQEFKQKIVMVATKEWELFKRQTMNNDSITVSGKKETDEGYWQIVLKYWKEGVENSNYTKKEVTITQIPWSAAFISYVMRRADPEKNFVYSASHYEYIYGAVSNRKNGRLNSPFIGYKIDEPQAILSTGDLICAPRGKDTEKVNYDNILTYRNSEGKKFFMSHCDVVIVVRIGEVDVIGGNVNDSVTKNTLKTRGGKIIHSPKRKWFVVIKNNA